MSLVLTNQEFAINNPALFKWHYILKYSHSQHEILFQGYEQYECGDCEGILFF